MGKTPVFSQAPGRGRSGADSWQDAGPPASPASFTFVQIFCINRRCRALHRTPGPLSSPHLLCTLPSVPPSPLSSWQRPSRRPVVRRMTVVFTRPTRIKIYTLPTHGLPAPPRRPRMRLPPLACLRMAGPGPICLPRRCRRQHRTTVRCRPPSNPFPDHNHPHLNRPIQASARNLL